MCRCECPGQGLLRGSIPRRCLLHRSDALSRYVSVPVRRSWCLGGGCNRVMSRGRPHPARHGAPWALRADSATRSSCSAHGATAQAWGSGRVGPALAAASAAGVGRADDREGLAQRAVPSHPPGVETAEVISGSITGRDLHCPQHLVKIGHPNALTCRRPRGCRAGRAGRFRNRVPGRMLAAYWTSDDCA